MSKLSGKVAVVTGGTRGIGLAICRTLASEGARVAVIGTSDRSVAPAIETLSGEGFDVKGYALNVAEVEATNEVFKNIIADFGTVDILVNNAGITRDTLMMRMKEDDWDSVLDINLKGAFNCTKAVMRTMMKARSGKIINMASVVGQTGNAGQVNYSASKAGLIGMTKSIAKELATRGINVNSIAPGFIETEMTAELSHAATDAFLENIPLARGGKPEDVAKAVVFLSSDDSDYITGQTINVDGGLVM